MSQSAESGLVAVVGVLVVAVVAWIAVTGRSVASALPTSPQFSVPSDLDPETMPREETAPLSQSGLPQLQVISTGGMTGPGEETTLEERGYRRQLFSGSETTGADSVYEGVEQKQSGDAPSWTVPTSGGL